MIDDTLNPRQRQVLTALVDHYIVRAEPVSSGVTIVTHPASRIPFFALCLPNANRNCVEQPHVARQAVHVWGDSCVLRGRRSSPLAPLQASWRGKGLRGSAMTRHPKTLFARKLRRRATFTEQIAWNMLRDGRFLGLKFRRQYVIRGFILDFYCFEHKLAIEIDGGIHEHQKEYDIARQEIIERESLSFVRISADELENSPERLLEQIRETISSSPKASTFPSPARLERD